MSVLHRLPACFQRALPVVLCTAVPLAAFLGFLIQPIMGKRLLPLYGGTAGTWLGCMVFFQLALLLGYGWAAWLARQPVRHQTAATAVLALVALVTFHLPPADPVEAAGIGHVVWRLSLACLPAMVLLFSTAPLAHAWGRRRGAPVPYYLYAVSNTGSLAALLLYPFVVETQLRLPEQAFFWHGLLVLVAGLLAAAAYAVYGDNVPAPAASSSATASPPAPDSAPPLAWPAVGAWLGLSALTTIGLLGATYHLTGEMGASPLAWIGPFGAFLFSFIVTFSGRWRPWMTLATVLWLALSLTGFMVAKGFTAHTVNAANALWLLSLTAAGSCLGNALLYELRPTHRVERFYLVLAAGGVLGGLASSLLVPALFPLPIEFPLVSALLLALGLVALTGTRSPGVIGALTAVVFLPVLGLGLQQSRGTTPAGTRLAHLRDLHGHLMLETTDTSVVLSSDTTTHGSQLTTDEASRRRPTLYYTESTGVGRVLEELARTRPALRVGVIGLGAGTLAAYARPADTFDFWDIDPKSLRVAREHFTFVAEAAGTINLIPRDGRKALEASTDDYDLLVLDAFTGDGVPSHLLTREALTVYFNRLAKHGGLLVVHTSTRYSHLFPVIEATARTLGRSSLEVATDIASAADARDWDPTHTDYVIVGHLTRIKAIAAWFPLEEDQGRVKRTLTTVNAPLIQRHLIWTDDRNAAIDAFDLDRFLFAR